MATSKKATAKKTVSQKATPGKKIAAKKAAPAKTSKKTAEAGDEEELEWLEIKKPAKKAAVKHAKLDLKPIKVKARTVGKGRSAKTIKAKKLGAAQVMAHLVETTGLARKDVKLVLETLADTMKAAIMPGGVGGAVIPGIGAVMRKEIAAKKIPAIKRGTVVEKRNMQTQEVTKWKHPGRPASVKPKTAKARFVLLSGTRRAVFGTA